MFDVIQTVIFYTYFATVTLGRFIVNITIFALKRLYFFIREACAVLKVIFEDFLTFCHDVLQYIYYLGDILSNIPENIVFGITSVIEGLHNVISFIFKTVFTIYDAIVNCLKFILYIIGQCFVLTKYGFLLFGDGVWFIISFIPKSTVNFIVQIKNDMGLLLQAINDTIYNKVLGCRSVIQLSVRNLYDFIADTPIESTIGIIVGLCLIYVFSQMYLVFYSYVKHKITVWLFVLYRKLKRMKFPVLSIKLPFLSGSRTDNKTDNICNDSLCIICQERSRSILILPCRHLCLCEECRILLYDDLCPLCRGRIKKSVKVFL